MDDEEDDEYNEITEAPQSSVLPAPNVSGIIFAMKTVVIGPTK